MEQPIIKRNSSKGNALEVGIAYTTPGAWYYYARVDGKHHAAPHCLAKISNKPPLVIDGILYTHAVGKVCLREDEVPVMMAAMSEARESYRTSPVGTAEALREERRTLVATIRGALDETEAARERGYNEDIGRIPSYDSPKYRSAKQAMAEFDRAHPEIKAEIEAEKQESIKRHMWD